MKTLAVISHKGGSGKTTLSVNMALGLWARGRRSLLIDVDPIRSASANLKPRAELASSIVATTPAKLAPLLHASERDGAEFVVIDTAGGSEDDMLRVIKVSDYCLVVARPTYLDIAAAVQTVAVVSRLNRRGAVVFSQCPPLRNGTLSSGITRTMELLNGAGLDVCPIAIQARAVYQRASARAQSVMECEPDGRAVEEMDAFLSFVVDALDPAQATVSPMAGSMLRRPTGATRRWPGYAAESGSLH